MNERETMASVLARLTKAGWISSSALDETNLVTNITPLGRQRLNEFWKALTEAGWPLTKLEIACLIMIAEQASQAPPEPD